MHKVVGKLISGTTKNSLKNSYVFVYVIMIYASKPESQFNTLRKNDNKSLYFQQLYISNRKVGEPKILCEDALSINLTLSQFISKSIYAIKRS
jgi:hypothetical protein